ncbi:poly(U)-specific endoribonuclease homolog isoform X2 [Venturia canescens]|uniref:poly(U)-specific endoribonuclease homolog isoform X2 n=1 Tax=Venturia canescens TaxID=32260 RepID=UPI001C9C6F60|nr:poly(U)-specific endoribonuclease homolog isoform X2 [Venturia canescens]
MEFSRFLVVLCLLVLIDSCVDARRSFSTSIKRGSGGSRGSSSRGTSKPRQPQTQQGGSSPDKIGWNVPAKQQPGGVGTKPSAPDVASKTSATNVQSGYQPSGGYNRQPAQNPAYGQTNGNQYQSGYNPPANQGYNPSVGGHHPYGAPPPYSPSHGAAPPPYSAHGTPYSPSHISPPAYNQPYNPYNPSYGHSYSSNPGAGYNPPVGHAPQTILVQQAGGGRPGIGQLAKEAFVFAGVSAGVNAAVNRILPGGIYGHSGSHGSGNVPAVAGPVSHTEITYNNYYNNGTAPATDPNATPAAAAAPVAAPAPPAPAPPAAAANPGETPAAASNDNAAPAPPSKPADPQDAIAQNNPSPLGFIITNADLKKVSEELSGKEKNNAFKFISLNPQGQKTDDSVTDDAPEPLMVVKDEAYELPTIKAVLALHDNYELDVRKKEEVTGEERREENELLEEFVKTETMLSTMKFLAEKGYIPNDEYEFKDALRRIWFSQFKRIDGDASSSGFETVFLAEQFDKEIIGLHNWIYFAKQEAAKKANYLGYIKQSTLGDLGAIVKMRLSLNDIVQPVTTIFVGTSPELEMALYTLCFFTRPNNPCPVTVGGTEFVIIANRVNYFGKDILVSAYPEI